MIRVEEYVKEDGFVPYRAWFDGLDVQAAAKVTTAVYRLSQGNYRARKNETAKIAPKVSGGKLGGRKR